MEIITNKQREHRLSELQQPEIDRLHNMKNKEMAKIILQAKFGEDLDYQSSDAGTHFTDLIN